MFSIVYKSAAQDSIKIKNSTTEVIVPSILVSNPDMFLKGKEDATLCYKSYKTAASGTFAASLITGPLFGLIPAIACASTEPLYQNLNYPDKELMKNIQYAQGFFETAKKLKSKKVWKNYAFGSIIPTVYVIVLGLYLH